MKNEAQIRILLLQQYLCTLTDEEHAASVSDILQFWESHGIQAGRKSVYGDIQILIDQGVDIVCVKSTQNRYFVGSRLFELPELKLLVDAVESSHFITRKKSASLIRKLASLTSQEQARQLNRPVYMEGTAKQDNEAIYYAVDMIHTAIQEKRRIAFQYASFLGYRKGPDGLPEIDPDEAAIVRRIFARYLLGQSVHQICRDLMSDGVKTAQGSDSWHDSVVRKMLQNEKYIGDALLQKTFMADLFTHEQRKNMGELPQYYVHECHPAIIDRDTFQRVQEELARRSSLRKTSSKAKTELGKYCGKYVLSELLVCGECGSPYRRVVWSRAEGKRIVWRCINRLEHGKKVCKKSPTWNETDIQAAVTAAMNELFHTQTAKEALEASITAALAGEDGELSLPALETQIHSLTERQLELFQLAVSAGPDCLDCDEAIQRVNMAKTTLMAKKAELEREGRTAAAFDRRMEDIANELAQTAGTITEFDEVTVRQLVSNIKVVSKDTLLICFKDGTEITQTV